MPIYICPPGYHHSGFVATHALGHEHLYDKYIYMLSIFLMINKPSIELLN